MNNSNTYTDRFLELLAGHPYLSAFAVCMFIHPFFLGAAENIPSNALLLEVIMIAFSVFSLLFHKVKKGKINKLTASAVMTVTVIAETALAYFYSGLENNRALWHFAGGILFTGLIFFLSDWKKHRRQMISLSVLASGFFLKLYYILGTSVLERQHDVFTFESEGGHAGYISYLIESRGLPDFDIRERFQFCHPPLHHIISAFWIWISNKCFGIDINVSRESVQTLTLFYSMCIMIAAYRILRHFKLEGTSLYIPLMVISFHPAFILFSGSINNDVLSTALTVCSVSALLDWYDNRTYRNIIKVALCIGAGMMAKLTAALIAPATALVFFIVLIKNFKKDLKKYLLQYTAFGAVCAPLGLWYEIRNYIKWKVPLTYVQELPEGLLQNVSEMPYKERITDFSKYQFASVFEQWLSYEDPESYNEHNPLIALLKNALFGEYINEWTFERIPGIIRFATGLFWIAAVIAALAFVCMVFTLISRNKMQGIWKAFFGVSYLTMMLNFYKMAYDYAFTCTLNFRYITFTVVVQMLFAGIILDKLNNIKKIPGKAVKIAACALSGCFVILTTVVYLAVCFVPNE